MIVAGPTYCERLWCVMEIFTFLRMGGDQERVTVRMMASQDEGVAAARRLLTKQFASFDAAKAQCFKVEDREKLLAVIEAAFGDFKEFNRSVRAVFATRVRPRGSTTRSSRRSRSVSRWIVGQREGELEDQACGAPAAAKARRRFGGSPFRRKRQPPAAAAGGAAAPALGLTDRSLAPTIFSLPEHRRHVRRGEGCPAWCGVWTVVAWW